jgi:hypothetical protein
MEPGFEEVFTVTDYYDGPRQGVANYQAQPHFYDRIFDDSRGEYSELFRLTPISQTTFQLAMEDWAIWRRWELAFAAQDVTLDTHPALREDRARHEEIKSVLDSALVTDEETCVLLKGLFEPRGAHGVIGVLRDFQVRWTDPTGR